MNFSWECQTPDKGWWANYRWHITEPSENLRLKSNDWKKSFFRKGWQGKILKVEGIESAKKCYQALQNGTITAFGGRFRGASYDKNAERIINQAKNSLKAAIKRHKKGESINIQEVAVVPSSYYNWRIIMGISGIVFFVVVVVLYLCLRKRKNKLKK